MIIVLSMHRSGSSMLTGLLEMAGLSIGQSDELFEIRPDNPKGYFERKDVVAMNDALLNDAGGAAMNPIVDFNSYHIDPELKEKLKELVSQLNKEEVTLLKDPRLCITLQYWLDQLSDVIVIYLYRHPYEVAKSLQRRQNIPINVGLALWEYYNVSAYRQCQDLSVYFVDLNEFTENPMLVFSGLMDWLRENKYRELNLKSNQLEEFFNPELFTSRLIEENGSGLSESQKHLYSNLKQGNHGGLCLISDETKRTLDIWADIVSLGFNVSKGRFVDMACEKTNTRLSRENSELIKVKSMLQNQNDALQSRYTVLGIRVKRLEGLLRSVLSSKAGIVLSLIDKFSSLYRPKNKGDTLHKKIVEVLKNDKV